MPTTCFLPSTQGRVTDLQYDNEGNIWACSEGQFTSLPAITSATGTRSATRKITNVHSILSDDDQKLWFTPDLRLFSGNLAPDSNAFPAKRSYDITPQ